jgi:uncharacterized protein (TIGR02145 family)
MCVFRQGAGASASACAALLLALSLSSLFCGCGKKSGQDSAPSVADPPAAAVGTDNVLADARDGKKYKTVEIGGRVWMAENLNYEAEGSKCYNDSASYCGKYGRLYDWATAVKVCPAGWKLPDTSDWGDLATAAGGGNKLKSTSGWNFNGSGTDEYGFTALPGGYWRSAVGDFIRARDFGFWWTATEDGSGEAYNRNMDETDNVSGIKSGKGNGYSVRCIKE